MQICVRSRKFPYSSQLQFLGRFDRILSIKSLISLVGAAGFEPTTCSTQNCRATRLRYTPNTPEHDSTELNHALALSFCLSTIFSENRVSTFPDHALGNDVDTRLRRDQQAASGRFIGR